MGSGRVCRVSPSFGGKERPEVQQNFPIRNRRDRFPLPAALHQDAARRRPRRHRHQEHLPQQFRQRLGQPAQAAAGEPATCTRFSTAPAAPSRAQALRPWCSSSRKARPPARPGTTSLDPGRNIGKTNPLNDADLLEFIELQKTFADSDKSLEWTLPALTRRVSTCR